MNAISGSEVLRSYARLARQLTGADQVSVYVPPRGGDAQAILVHDGEEDPAEWAPGYAASVSSAGATQAGPPARTPNQEILIPLEVAGGDERRADRPLEVPPTPDSEARLCLRFSTAESGQRRSAVSVEQEPWWPPLIALAASCAAQARGVPSEPASEDRLADVSPQAAREESPGIDVTPATPEARLRRVLAREIAAARGPSGLRCLPLGKWLAEDLVLAASRMFGGVHRETARRLGLPDTTYRRRLRRATANRAAGLDVRSPGWPAVVSVLHDVLRQRADGSDLLEWAQACLLAELECAAPGDVRTAAALVGVSEATLLRHRAAAAE